MKSIFDLIVNYFAQVVKYEFFFHIVMCMVIIWLFSVIYSFRVKR